MMYQNDFVAVVKANGQILREDKNNVFLPFASEYSILMKNLFGRKALVSVSIDGTDVLNGKKLIINANSEIELERFLDDLDKGNKFKFIQKTQKIQEHRGDKIDDGIIRIEFQFEKEPVKFYNPIITNTWTYNNSTPRYLDNQTTYTSDNSSYTKSISPSNFSTRGCATMDSINTSYSCDTTQSLAPQSINLNNVPLQDEGITVKGSESTQKFRYGSIGVLEDTKHVITLQLKGCSGTGKEIVEPLTVKTKKECPTCGTVNKNVNKYCRECGTFLE